MTSPPKNLLFFLCAAIILQICDSFVATQTLTLPPSLQIQQPILANKELRHLCSHLYVTPRLTRRDFCQQTVLSTGVISIVSFPLEVNAVAAAAAPPPAAAAAAAANGDISYTVEPFVFTLPKSWNVIVKNNKNNEKKKLDGKLFSAIDFSTGAVLTVVEEQICSPVEYAANVKQCDMVATISSGGRDGIGKETTLPFSSPETLSRDISKLLIRHDDRDNAALQGSTRLESVDTVTIDSRSSSSSRRSSSSSSNRASSWNVYATTNIPTGGTYTYGMGLDQPNMLARTVQTKVVKTDENPYRVISLWLTAATDDWNKPTTGLKLREIWKSVHAQL